MSSTTVRGHKMKAIDDMATVHGIVKLAGAELGVESFGIQVFDIPPGFNHYPEHDHADDGQEEVYVVLRGAAEFDVEGERMTIDSGRMLWVGAGSRRRLLPGSEDVRILALGCTPGKPYKRPQDFQLEAGK